MFLHQKQPLYLASGSVSFLSVCLDCCFLSIQFTNTETCIDFEVEQVIVMNAKPALVTVYDYYETSELQFLFLSYTNTSDRLQIFLQDLDN